MNKHSTGADSFSLSKVYIIFLGSTSAKYILSNFTTLFGLSPVVKKTSIYTQRIAQRTNEFQMKHLCKN